MKIPFFSKRNKKILKENESRIFLLTESQQQDLLNDPDIKVEDKVFQLLKENNELKVLFDELQDQLSKDLKSGGTYVLEIAKHSIEFISDVKVLPDSKIKYKNKIVDIDEPERVGRMRIFDMFGRRTKQFRLFFVEPEGEYTFDPSDKTPIEIKKRSEEIIKTKNETTKAAFIQNILRGLKGAKGWYEYIPYIMWGLTIFGIILVIFWWLSGYGTLTKPVTTPNGGIYLPWR